MLKTGKCWDCEHNNDYIGGSPCFACIHNPDNNTLNCCRGNVNNYKQSKDNKSLVREFGKGLSLGCFEKIEALRKNSLTPEEMKELIKLYDEGKGTMEISETMKKNIGLVRSFLYNKYGDDIK